MMSFPDFQYKQVIVHVAGGSGERLRFLADNVVIEDKDKKCILRHSCHRIFALFIIGEVTVTSVLIKQAKRFDFPIILMSGNFRVIARLNNGAEGNTLLREKQYELSGRTMPIARELIAQKIANQMALIKALRYQTAEDKACLEFLKTWESRGPQAKVFSPVISAISVGHGVNRDVSEMFPIFFWILVTHIFLILLKGCFVFMGLIYTAVFIIHYTITENLLSVI